LDLAQGKPDVRRRLLGHLKAQGDPESAPGEILCTFHELYDRAAVCEAKREAESRRQEIQAERERLLALGRRREQEWQEIHALIAKATGKAYPQAIQKLQALHELAKLEEALPAFQSSVDELAEKYRNKHSLIRRLREAGLVPG